MKSLLVLQLLFFVVSLACKCRTYSWKKIFDEEAKWVSHVKVNTRKIDHQSVVYEVRHIEIFKAEENKIDEKIVTLSSSSACGVPDLKPGEEYLLAGTYGNKVEPRLISCLVFTQKDKSSQAMGAVLWNDASPELLRMLKTGNFVD